MSDNSGLVSIETALRLYIRLTKAGRRDLAAGVWQLAAQRLR
ncbi:MAG TPA: hypothetical protein VGN96_08230 [Roseococcus sp.]|nr:hypothetical protein [Roseococcus sp.]